MDRNSWFGIGQTNVGILKYDGTELSYHKNSVNAAFTNPGAISNVTVTDDLYLFSRAESQYFGNGQIFEIPIFNNALTDTEITKVNYYLSKKWGLEE